MPEALFILPIFGRERVQRLGRSLQGAALLTRGRLRRVAAALTDAGMRGDRLEPLLVAKVARGDFGGGDQVFWTGIRPALQQRCSPAPVREARVQLLLGLRIGQGVEPGYAADDETLTFQLDG